MEKLALIPDGVWDIILRDLSPKDKISLMHTCQLMQARALAEWGNIRLTWNISRRTEHDDHQRLLPMLMKCTRQASVCIHIAHEGSFKPAYIERTAQLLALLPVKQAVRWVQIASAALTEAVVAQMNQLTALQNVTLTMCHTYRHISNRAWNQLITAHPAASRLHVVVHWAWVSVDRLAVRELLQLACHKRYQLHIQNASISLGREGREYNPGVQLTVWEREREFISWQQLHEKWDVKLWGSVTTEVLTLLSFLAPAIPRLCTVVLLNDQVGDDFLPVSNILKEAEAVDFLCVCGDSYAAKALAQESWLCPLFQDEHSGHSLFARRKSSHKYQCSCHSHGSVSEAECGKLTAAAMQNMVRVRDDTGCVSWGLCTCRCKHPAYEAYTFDMPLYHEFGTCDHVEYWDDFDDDDEDDDEDAPAEYSNKWHAMIACIGLPSPDISHGVLP